MWLFTQLLAKLQNDFYEPSAVFMEKFPIPPTTIEKQAPLIKLVDKILTAKQRDARADTSEMEQEIDRHVYALYGLTPEETCPRIGRRVQIVEASSQ